jgi:hypothetical protein
MAAVIGKLSISLKKHPNLILLTIFEAALVRRGFSTFYPFKLSPCSHTIFVGLMQLSWTLVSNDTDSRRHSPKAKVEC